MLGTRYCDGALNALAKFQFKYLHDVSCLRESQEIFRTHTRLEIVLMCSLFAGPEGKDSHPRAKRCIAAGRHGRGGSAGVRPGLCQHQPDTWTGVLCLQGTI